MVNTSLHKVPPRKALDASQAQVLEQIPNIGSSLAADLRSIGIQTPAQLRGQDALSLFQSLSRLKRQRQDPCVLDTFLAAVDFMNGAAAAPWWTYTPARKARFGLQPSM